MCFRSVAMENSGHVRGGVFLLARLLFASEIQGHDLYLGRCRGLHLCHVSVSCLALAQHMICKDCE